MTRFLSDRLGRANVLNPRIRGAGLAGTVIVLWLVLPVLASAAPRSVPVTVAVTPGEVTLGDVVTYSVSVLSEEAGRKTSPAGVAEALTRANLHVLPGMPRVSVVDGPEGGRRKRWEWRARVFALGEVEVPGGRLLSRDPGGGASMSPLPTATVQVNPVPPRPGEDPSALREAPRGPVSLPEGLPLGALLGMLGMLAVVLGTAAYYRWWAHPAAETALPAPPPLPPYEAAKAALDELRQSGMLDRGENVQYVDRLSILLRTYLGGRFEFPALEETTTELMSSMRARLPDRGRAGQRDVLRRILEECDLAKFAQYRPKADMALEMTDWVEEFVESTRPRPEPPPETDETHT